MRNLVYILLIGGMLAQVFSKTLLWGYHQVNQEELTRLFCINTDKPEKNCKGTCYLRRQLSKTENTEKHNHRLTVEKQDIQLFCQQAFKLVLSNTSEAPVSETCYYTPFFQAPVFPVFHPPA